MRALVLGHFSTVGDIESLELVRELLRSEAMPYDVAPFSDKFVTHIEGSMSFAQVDPARYTHLIVVCGPLWPEFLAKRGVDLHRFAHCTRIGVNLTMIEALERWNPFHLLLERDSNRSQRPDLTFLRETARVPVAGLCTIARQREYGSRQRHGDAIAVLDHLLQSRGLAALNIDTRWPAERNEGGLGSPEQVLSVIGRVDVLLTNRLHGLVFALKAGIPALAIDPVHGGDKIIAQAEVLGWPAAIRMDEDTEHRAQDLLDWCLSAEGRKKAIACADAARSSLAATVGEFRASLHQQFPSRPLPPMRASVRTPVMKRLRNALRHRRQTI
jgi:hypothetical protein